MSSLYSVFSFFRCTVASATDLSSFTMPASSVAMSSFSVSMLSFIAAISVSWSAMDCSRCFVLSSTTSNSILQYSFLLSSSSCSFFSSLIMLSHIAMTLVKPPWRKARLPTSPSTRKSKPARCRRPAFFRAARSSARARPRISVALTLSCRKLALALGSVFLNNSNASSLLSSWIVSAKATSSSDRVFERCSNSFFLVLQLLSRPARNFLSSSRPSWVSESVSLKRTRSTPSSPICFVFVSMETVMALVSFVLASMDSL
mmetsp:Transcript_64503/g.200019  ORF Transcript_64503/g.200019 Transcript_64503/m.200019 type:complete len:259 (-) Transcript_64503:786-1562(-)